MHAIAQIALADLLGGFQQRGDGRADLSGHVARDPDGEEQNEQRDQREQQQVQAAEGLLVHRQAIIIGDRTIDLAAAWPPDPAACAQKEPAVPSHRSERCAVYSSPVARVRNRAKHPRAAVRIAQSRAFFDLVRLAEAFVKIGALGDRLGRQPVCLGGELVAALPDSSALAICTRSIFMVCAGRLNHLSRFRFSTDTLHSTRKNDRQDAERQRAADQLGLDVRAGPVALPLDVQLHAGAEQHEAQRHGEDEDQRGNGPEQSRSAGCWRARAQSDRG